MRISNAPWLKIVEFREPAADDRWITGRGLIGSGKDENGFLRPIVAPDNDYDALDLSALKIPEGYEIDGASAAEAFGDMEPGGIGLHPKECKPVQYVGAPNGPDTRRIRLRKIAPKTRKVLVAEMELSGKVDRSAEAWLRSPLPLPFDRGRIEERPL